MSKMKHIVIVTTSFPTKFDGSEAAGSFVADFASEISNHARVTVVAPTTEAVEANFAGNMRAVYFQVPSLPLSTLKPYKPIDAIAILRTIKSGTQCLERIIQHEKVNHIFSLWVLPSGHWANVVGKKHNISYSTWALGSDIWSLSKIPVIKNRLKTVLLQSKMNFADGYQLKNDVEKISSRHCEFLPSTRSFPSSPDSPRDTVRKARIAYLGRWHPNKGTDILMKSFSLLSDKDWEKIEEVRVAGGGPLENDIQLTVTKLLKACRPISLSGYLTKDEAHNLFTWADYVLIPSRIESIPVVFSDAIKCGCGIVAMPVGDLPALLEKYNVGKLAKDVNEFEFVDAIRQILDCLPSEFKDGFKAAESDFNIEVCVNRLLKSIF